LPHQPQTHAADPATLSVTGTGIVSATPDMATVTSGVTTQGPTAGEALAANSKAMADLLAALTAAGIADKDVQTSNFSVNPNYIYPICVTPMATPCRPGSMAMWSSTP